MKSKIYAEKIIQLIKARSGIEVKQICAELDMTIGQFNSALPFVRSVCTRRLKKWHITIVDEVPLRIRKNPTATIIYNMMPVGQMGLKERMGMHKDAIWRALKLLKEHNLVHITGYETNKTTIFPIFAKGRGIDAVRPSSNELANKRSNRYKANNIEAVQKKNQTYREKNRELLKFKQMARYWENADELNEKAREKARLKREGLAKPMKVATQWRGGNPFVTIGFSLMVLVK